MTSTAAVTASARTTALREITIFLGTTAALLAASTTTALSLGVDVAHIESAPPLGQAVLFGQAAFPLIAAVMARLATTGTLRGNGWGFRRVGARNRRDASARRAVLGPAPLHRGAVLALLGRTAEARADLARAATIAERLGMRPFLDRARRSLASLDR